MFPGPVGRLLSADADGADNGAGPLVVELNIGRQVFSCATFCPASASSNTTHWYRFCFVLKRLWVAFVVAAGTRHLLERYCRERPQLSCSAGLEA
jgi:hypothetical protein